LLPEDEPDIPEHQLQEKGQCAETESFAGTIGRNFITEQGRLWF
jgi:hypothetical protein